MKKAIPITLLVFALALLTYAFTAKDFNYKRLMGLETEIHAAKLPYYEKSTTSVELDTVEHVKKECEAGGRILQENNLTDEEMKSRFSYQELMMGGVCIGKMNAFLMMKSNPKVSCAPEFMTIGQGIAIFLKWADENPEKSKYVYMAGFMEAFHEAYPCSDPTPIGR